MAGSSLLLLIDDIAAVLDDVSLMTKMAAKKTAGVLGDDLAVNAEKVTGVRAEREIPVVWAVAKGSFKKQVHHRTRRVAAFGHCALGHSPGFDCWRSVPVLRRLRKNRAQDVARQGGGGGARGASRDPGRGYGIRYRRLRTGQDQGAIRTDFILSLEIIVLTLGIVADSDFTTKFLVLCGISMIMTVRCLRSGSGYREAR